MCICIVAHVCKCLPFSLHICMYVGMTDWCLVAAMDCIIAAAAAGNALATKDVSINT